MRGAVLGGGEAAQGEAGGRAACGRPGKGRRPNSWRPGPAAPRGRVLQGEKRTSPRAAGAVRQHGTSAGRPSDSWGRGKRLPLAPERKPKCPRHGTCPAGHRRNRHIRVWPPTGSPGRGIAGTVPHGRVLKLLGLSQSVGQKEEVAQGDAVIGGGVFGRIALAIPLVPNGLGRLAPRGGLGEVRQRLGRPGQSGGAGKRLVERPLLLGEICLAGELAEAALKRQQSD